MKDQMKMLKQKKNKTIDSYNQKDVVELSGKYIKERRQWIKNSHARETASNGERASNLLKRCVMWQNGYKIG